MLKGLRALFSDSQALPSTFTTCCQHNVRCSLCSSHSAYFYSSCSPWGFCKQIKCSRWDPAPAAPVAPRNLPTVASGPRDQLLKMRKPSSWSSFHLFLCKKPLCVSRKIQCKNRKKDNTLNKGYLLPLSLNSRSHHSHYSSTVLILWEVLSLKLS